MTADEILQQATADIGGYILSSYRDQGGTLHAANAVSALGACAGAFAQVQARAMLMFKRMRRTETTFYEVTASDGRLYVFGDAINLVLMEGAREAPSFWNLAAGAARDPKIGEKIDLIAIARRTAKGVGGSDFGKPRIDARYQLSQAPIEAVRAHGAVLLQRFLKLDLDPSGLMLAFGAAGQSFAAFAAGEIADVRVNVAMKRADIVRLYMESAIPMSKLDLPSVGIVTGRG